jgi:hypothetical protein
MITGTHTILYSSNPEADRNFLLKVLNPSELFLLCDDIQHFIQQMTDVKIHCDPAQNQRWGYLTYLTLPGGGKLGVYEPLHPRPAPMT